MALEDGEELILTEISPDSPSRGDCVTPKSPAQKTPRRSLKRKREEDESEVQIKYLDIAQKQANAMQAIILLLKGVLIFYITFFFNRCWPKDSTGLLKFKLLQRALYKP